jgi:hypothetical protein
MQFYQTTCYQHQPILLTTCTGLYNVVWHAGSSLGDRQTDLSFRALSPSSRICFSPPNLTCVIFNKAISSSLLSLISSLIHSEFRHTISTHHRKKFTTSRFALERNKHCHDNGACYCDDDDDHKYITTIATPLVDSVFGPTRTVITSDMVRYD